jgi:nitrite reductase/ring-hydroxylating ferredoxin subunit
MMPKLCNANEVTDSGREFRISTGQGAWFVMVFRRGDTIVAYQNICPHRYLSLSWAPDRFLLGDDGLLVCPHHGAAFELDNGVCLQGPCEGDKLTPAQVRIENGEVWLD